MTPAQLEAMLDRLKAEHGFGQNDAAQTVGLTDRTIRHYLNGKRRIPNPFETALVLIEAMGPTEATLALLRYRTRQHP
jgi:plasmid maintenance system antidote protein VapI